MSPVYAGQFSLIVERPIVEVDAAFIEFIMKQSESYSREAVSSSLIAYYLSTYTYGDLGSILLRGISAHTKITDNSPLYPAYEEPIILYRMEAEGHISITEAMNKAMEEYCQETGFDYKSLYETNLRRRWREIRIQLHDALIGDFVAYLKEDGLIRDSSTANTIRVSEPNLNTKIRYEVIKKIKDAHPNWSQARVAIEASEELGEVITATTVQNVYRLMKQKWIRGDRAR